MMKRYKTNSLLTFKPIQLFRFWGSKRNNRVVRQTINKKIKHKIKSKLMKSNNKNSKINLTKINLNNSLLLNS